MMLFLCQFFHQTEHFFFRLTTSPDRLNRQRVAINGKLTNSFYGLERKMSSITYNATKLMQNGSNMRCLNHKFWRQDECSVRGGSGGGLSEGGSKCVVVSALSTHKQYCERRPYNKRHRISFSRLCLSSHEFTINTGSWNRRGHCHLPVEERLFCCTD